jgi:uncharacterized lipoprotein YddW (UPF0748 family)
MLRPLPLVLLALWLLPAGRLGAQTHELRGWWVDTFNAALRTPAEVAQLVANARTANFNALFVEVRKRGDAYYDSRFEPKAADVSPATFDPLAELLRLAHDTSGGKPRIEVHAWIVTYNIWNSRAGLPPQPAHPYRRHPEWLTQDNTGVQWDGANYAFDPAHPAVQDHTFNVALDLVTRYAVDGLHFDYVRYGGREWGYHPVAVERFRRIYNRPTTPGVEDLLWKQFRRDQVTALVRRVYLAAAAVKPAVKISAATITFAPGITATAQWTTSAAYTDVLQDWRAWMEEGILDLNVPMAYFRQPQNGADWSAWSTFAKNHRYRRHVALGVATYLNTPADSLRQLRSTRTAATQGPAHGMVLYSYAAPASDTTTRSRFMAALTGGLPGDTNPALFPAPAQVPPMPWKSAPTNGLLLARLAGSDGVLVTLAGSLNRTVRTDANGWFGAVEVPVGEVFCRATLGERRWLARADIAPGVVAQPILVPADEDADGDGFTNEEELVFGTETQASNSRPRLGLTPGPDGNQLTLTPAQPRREYSLWQAQSLAPDATWEMVARTVTGTGAANGPVTFPPQATPGATAFFRVQVRPFP